MRVAHLSDFGADPAGRADSSRAFTDAFAAMAGGGVLLAEPTDRYLLGSSVTASSVTGLMADFRGATIFGPSNRRLIFESCTDCRIENLASQGPFSGVSLRWCRECIVSKVSVHRAASAFSMHLCRDCQFRDCEVTEGTGIPFLLHVGDRNQAVGCSVSGGACTYAFQVKGGPHNRLLSCSVRDCDCEVAFRDRGDAPWKASATASKKYPYPWPDGTWSKPDERRASHCTVIQDCEAENVSGTAFAAQEAVGTTLLNVRAKGCRHGAVFTRTRSGGERGYVMAGFRFEALGSSAVIVQSNDVESLAGTRLSEGEIGESVLQRNAIDTSIYRVA